MLKEGSPCRLRSTHLHGDIGNNVGSHVLAVRGGRESLFRIGLLSNKPLLGAVLLTMAAQAVLLVPSPLQRALGVSALAPLDLAICGAAGALVFVVDELVKWGRRRRSLHGLAAAGPEGS